MIVHLSDAKLGSRRPRSRTRLPTGDEVRRSNLRVREQQGRVGTLRVREISPSRNFFGTMVVQQFSLEVHSEERCRGTVGSKDKSEDKSPLHSRLHQNE